MLIFYFAVAILINSASSLFSINSVRTHTEQNIIPKNGKFIPREEIKRLYLNTSKPGEFFNFTKQKHSNSKDNSSEMSATKSDFFSASKYKRLFGPKKRKEFYLFKTNNEVFDDKRRDESQDYIISQRDILSDGTSQNQLSESLIIREDYSPNYNKRVSNKLSTSSSDLYPSYNGKLDNSIHGLLNEKQSFSFPYPKTQSGPVHSESDQNYGDETTSHNWAESGRKEGNVHFQDTGLPYQEGSPEFHSDYNHHNNHATQILPPKESNCYSVYIAKHHTTFNEV